MVLIRARLSGFHLRNEHNRVADSMEKRVRTLLRVRWVIWSSLKFVLGERLVVLRSGVRVLVSLIWQCGCSWKKGAACVWSSIHPLGEIVGVVVRVWINWSGFDEGDCVCGWLWLELFVSI
ncbi:hypothetical protein Droror1_Dr00010646 [Drosera rotundifolia]